jgi:hypothetical protein
MNQTEWPTLSSRTLDGSRNAAVIATEYPTSRRQPGRLTSAASGGEWEHLVMTTFIQEAFQYSRTMTVGGMIHHMQYAIIRSLAVRMTSTYCGNWNGH